MSSEADSEKGKPKSSFSFDKLNQEIAEILDREGPDAAIEHLSIFGGETLLRYLKFTAAGSLQHEDLEDALLELHVRLWRFFRRDSFVPTNAPLAVVKTMAKNLVIDVWRRNSRHASTNLDATPLENSHAAVQEAAESEVLEQFDLVQEFVDRLQGRQGQVAKRYLELACGPNKGSIHARIAKELDISPEASKRAWSVVLTKLRLHFGLPMD